MNHLLKITPLIACIALTACSGNPFQKQTPHEAARILSNASLAAMKSLGYKGQGMSDRYARCMEHKTAAFFDCERLYQTMTQALSAQGIKVRITDLTDKKFYEHIKEDLKLISYTSL